MIRLADYVIKFLEKKGITTVFTVSGGGSIFLCDALYKSKKIEYVSHHHEQAASFAAESYARAKKKCWMLFCYYWARRDKHNYRCYLCMDRLSSSDICFRTSLFKSDN